jgi:hypothetical protein
MDPQGTTFLSTIDRVASSSKLINRAIEFLVSKISPQTTAKAVCQGNYHYCRSEKGNWCYWYCNWDGSTCRRYDVYDEVIYYDTTGSDCTSGVQTCIDSCDYIQPTTMTCYPCPI